MKVKPANLERMSLAMRAVMIKLFITQELLSKENLRKLDDRSLWSWWMYAYGCATYNLTTPCAAQAIYRDETMELYPDDTNDKTMITALKRVRDMIVDSFDDFVMVVFPNLTKELSGVSFYKFNHNKAFIYCNGVEVEVPRKVLTSRDPYVLAQIALTWQTMASPLVDHPKMPIEPNRNDLILQSVKPFYDKYSATGGFSL